MKKSLKHVRADDIRNVIKYFGRNVLRRERKTKILTYFARYLHFDERWAQSELCHMISQKYPHKYVWMEDKRRDCTIYSGKGKEEDLECVIEIKTVKNFDIGYWLSPLKRDIVKLKNEKCALRIFVVISLTGKPKKDKQKDKTYEKYTNKDELHRRLKNEMRRACKLKRLIDVDFNAQDMEEMNLSIYWAII